jgi:hypothetical protein
MKKEHIVIGLIALGVVGAGLYVGRRLWSGTSTDTIVLRPADAPAWSARPAQWQPPVPGTDPGLVPAAAEQVQLAEIPWKLPDELPATQPGANPAAPAVKEQ